MIFKQIGMNLRFLRKKSKLSQNDLGGRLNITRQQVANYEKGDTTIPFLSLYRISDIFNISIDEIIGDKLEQIFDSDVLPASNTTPNIITEAAEYFLQKGNVKVSHKEIANYFIIHFDKFMEDELIKLKISNLVKDEVIDYLEKNIKLKK